MTLLALVGALSTAGVGAAQQPRAIGAEDALATALAASPELRAVVLDAVAARAATRAAEDARAPVVTASANGSFTESFSGTADGAVRNDARALNAAVGLAWTSDVGTVVGLDLATGASWRTVNRDPSTTTSFTIGPNYTGSLTLSARQPILRGAGRDVVRAAEREAAATERQSVESRDAQASAIVRDVLVAYWELWYAERALDVQREAVALATRQADDARERVALGTLANAERLQFASTLAGLRETERSAQATRRQRAVELARLLGVDPDALATATDAPTSPTPPSLDALVAQASEQAPELRSLEAAVEAARQRVVSARDASRARLDFVGRAGMVTLWADDTLPGLQLPDGRPGFVVSGGLELELPVGSSAADAQHTRAQAQLEAAEARLEVAQRDLRASLATAYETTADARDRIALAAEAAEVAEELAEAERGRLELGTTTPADLVAAQQDARAAELRRLRTVVDAVTNARRLEDAAGALLDRFALRASIERAGEER
ncbi:MAG: TolC family protein [Sandaracinus sp.]|nr:TolC family protein [Sandaracinus sp.]